MRKIIIHNPCNEHTRYFRDYNLFWDDLTDELKKRYKVTENRYYEFANSQRFTVELKNQTCPASNFVLLECEYVIEFEDTGEFYVLSASDVLTHAILNEKSNDSLKKVLISQFRTEYFANHPDSYSADKYKPWIYFPSQTLDLSEFYNKRKDIPNLIDKMYFRGTSIEDRPILKHLGKNVFEGPDIVGGPESYFNDLINYKIGLAVGGRGELCYRDIEYMAIGIPFIRFEYTTELNPNLIPNYHYISVDRPEGLVLDRAGNEEHAKMLEQRFLEVKDNKELLDFISTNAKEYYDTYFSRSVRVQHTLNLLGL
jgi:hypothetical protein